MKRKHKYTENCMIVGSTFAESLCFLLKFCQQFCKLGGKLGEGYRLVILLGILVKWYKNIRTYVGAYGSILCSAVDCDFSA